MRRDHPRIRAAVLAVLALPASLGGCALIAKSTLVRRPGSDVTLPARRIPELRVRQGEVECASLPIGFAVFMIGELPRCVGARADRSRPPLPAAGLPKP
jgi:hypothetical protein